MKPASATVGGRDARRAGVTACRGVPFVDAVPEEGNMTVTGRIDAVPSRVWHEEVLAPQFAHEVANLLPHYVRIEKVLLLEYLRMGLVDAAGAAAIARRLDQLDPADLLADPAANMSDISFALERFVDTRRLGFARAVPHALMANVARLTSSLRSAREAADTGDIEAHRALENYVLRIVGNDPPTSPWFTELHEDLLADGFELRWELEEFMNNTAEIKYRLVPTDAAAVPLAEEVTALEDELAARGYVTVLNHYQQAVDGLVHGKYESANGDLRTALEDLVTRLATDNEGFQPALGSNGQPKANQGGLAITHLVDTTKRIPLDDGGMMLRGLWKMSCTNGPHPGRSNADEA